MVAMIVILGLPIWALLVIAPWFFMLARLKNMGFTGNSEYLLHEIERLYQVFGALTTISVMFCAVVGVLADVIFNAFWGSLIFREWPREVMFTKRVKRWSKSADRLLSARNPTGYAPIKPPGAAVPYDLNHQQQMGLRWRTRLNRIMEGHV